MDGFRERSHWAFSCFQCAEFALYIFFGNTGEFTSGIVFCCCSVCAADVSQQHQGVQFALHRSSNCTMLDNVSADHDGCNGCNDITGADVINDNVIGSAVRHSFQDTD